MENLELVSIASFDSLGDNTAVALFRKVLYTDEAASFSGRKIIDTIKSHTAFGQVIAETFQIAYKLLLARLQLLPQPNRHAKVRFMDVLNAIGSEKCG